MSRDPFSDANHPLSSQYNPLNQRPMMRPPAPPTATPWMKILGVIGVLGILFCGGLVGVGYLALQSSIAPPAVDLPARPSTLPDAFRADADAFNASLSTADTFTEVPESIQTFIDDAVEAGLVDDAIPFDEGQFIAAINNSPDVGEPLDFIDRLAISTWLDEYVPTPNKLDDYHRIVNVELSLDQKLATVSIIFYSEENQADSQQWYLVADGDRWKVYDWHCLEYGRRMSDEYAAYLRGAESIAPGYDLAMEKINDAFEVSESDGVDAAIGILRQAESTPMLVQDRDVARLRIAQAYMALQRYDLAIETLERIKSPDQMWGVYPAMAICQLNTDNLDLAMECATKAESQSPDHPRTHWLISMLLEEMGQTDEAADRAVLALAGCPRDQMLVSQVTENRRPKDIALLIRAADATDSYAYAMLADSASYDATWASALIDYVDQNAASTKVPKGFLELLLGNRAWAQEDYDEAAKQFLAARNVADDPEIRDVAFTDHVNSRIEDDRYAELLEESDDLAETMSTIAAWVFAGDFYGNSDKLLTALQQRLPLTDTASSSVVGRWTQGIAGWCRHEAGDDRAASKDLVKFVEWRKTLSPDEISADRWLDDGARTTLAQSMLNIDDIDGLLTILPDSAPVQTMVIEKLRHGGVDDARRFLNSKKSASEPMMQLLSARLQAAVTSMAGDVVAADAWHTKASAMAGDLDLTDATDLLRTLRTERARDLVWNRVLPSEVELPTDSDDAQALIVDVVADAVVLQDADMVQAWTQLAKTIAVDAEQQTVIDRELYHYYVSQGRYDDAANLFQKPDPNDLSDAAAVDHELRQLALLRAGRFDEVTAEAELLESNSDEGAELKLGLADSPVDAAKALVALVSGNAELLDAILWQRDQEEVSDWLSYVVPDEFLDANVNDPAMASTLHRYPFAVGYRSANASGQLLLDGQPSLTPQAVNDVLAATFGEPFDAVEINSFEPSNDAIAWLAMSASGHRFLIDVRPRTLRSSGLPDKIKRRSAAPLKRLAISVLDHSGKPQKRLIEAAQSLAEAFDENAIAFQWSDRLLTWFDSDDQPLREQLRWTDRIPVSHQTLRQALFYRDEHVVSVNGFHNADYWTAELKKAGEPLSVVMTVQLDDTVESIPSTLIGVGADGYRLLVEPKIDSKLNPLVDAGFPCRIGSIHVRHVD